MEIHALIKMIRKDLGLSQKKFAEKLHISFSTVNRWENGHVTPN
ncbi:helix-turn-helix domain-containing protein [Clostridium sp. Marseille-P2415]|nr:helix-turn-helix transcriptional regulator [Clostridium sp. Marseille-P2415]